MITTICLNPCFDKTVSVDRLQPGQVNRIREARVDLGGNAINVAVVARRLGLDARCIGIMGENGAAALTSLMDRENLVHRFLTVPGDVRTNMKVYSLDGQGVTELNEPGTHLTENALNEFTGIVREETAAVGNLIDGIAHGTGKVGVGADIDF